MPIQQCPIDIPEGYGFVAFRAPRKGEMFCVGDGIIGTADDDYIASKVIVRPVPPPLQVGDWVRVVQEDTRYGGEIGRVNSCLNKCVGIYIGSKHLWFAFSEIRKQTRTVEPYNIDQLIETVARLKSRHVRILKGNAMTMIESIHIAGVTLSDSWAGFISYVDAADRLQWDSGEAFGTEGWRDAE